jgi:anion-transporting  ArsA/GET3 family ATPase
VRALAERLADPARTALVVVALPERIPAAEAKALRDRAGAAGVAPSLFVVNRLERATSCSRCGARREAALAVARALASELAPAPLAFVGDAEDEPRGIAALRALAFAPSLAEAAA